MKIEFDISDFQYAVLAHNQVSVADYVQDQTERTADAETRRLAERAIQAALNDSETEATMTMDRTEIVNDIFANPEYKNAEQRKAAREQAQQDLDDASAAGAV